MVIKEQECYVIVRKDGRRVKLHKLDGTYKAKMIVKGVCGVDRNSKD